MIASRSFFSAAVIFLVLVSAAYSQANILERTNVSSAALEARDALLNSQQAIGEMKKTGFNTTRVEDIFEVLLQFYEGQITLEANGTQESYTDIIKRTGEITKIRNEAFDAKQRLRGLELRLESTKANKTEPLELYRLAEIDIQSERYEEAKIKIEQAYKKIADLEAAQTRSRVVLSATKSLGQRLLEEWKIVLIGIITAAIIIAASYDRIIVFLLRRKIENFEAERKTLEGLIRETQENYFGKGKLAENTYHINIGKFGEMIRDIERQLPLLREQLEEHHSWWAKIGGGKPKLPQPKIEEGVESVKKWALPAIKLPKISLPKLSIPEIKLLKSKPAEKPPQLQKIAVPPKSEMLRLEKMMVQAGRRPTAAKFQLPKLSLPFSRVKREKISEALKFPARKIEKKAQVKIEPPKLRLPKISAPKISFPKVTLPKLPHIKAPQVSFPKFRIPKFELPKIELPKLQIPKFKAPQFKLPKFKAPHIKLPQLKPREKRRLILEKPELLRKKKPAGKAHYMTLSELAEKLKEKEQKRQPRTAYAFKMPKLSAPKIKFKLPAIRALKLPSFKKPPLLAPLKEEFANIRKSAAEKIARIKRKAKKIGK